MREFFISSEDLNKVSTVGIQIVDAKGILVCYSKGCEKIEGYQQKKVIGKSVYDLYTSRKELSNRFNFEHRAVIDEVYESKKEQKDIFVSYTLKDSVKIINTICDAYPILGENEEINYVIIIFSNVADHFNMMGKMNRLKAELHQKNLVLKNDTQYTFNQIIGSSEKFKAVIEEAKKLAQNEGEVLIVGETGTGKELFVQSIHNASTRCDKQFVSLNCSAIPENLMETMLFGSCKGAYTGAVNQRGLLEEAEGGTLFLDEINSMSLVMQAKLLRLLETKRFRKVGSSKEQSCNIRFISAMNEDPKVAIAANQLRLDIYYRIGMFVLFIPPLRERKKDIRCLASYFARTTAAACGKRAIQLSDKTMKMFMNYPWPGNVRELKHVITQCVYLAHDDDLYLMPHHLRSNEIINSYQPSNALYHETRIADETNLNINLKAYEKVLIKEALEKNDKNVSKTAKYLHITRQSLHGKIKKYKLDEKNEQKEL